MLVNGINVKKGIKKIEKYIMNIIGITIVLGVY